MNYGCKCEAVSASPAAYRQMTGAQKVDFWFRVSDCQSCKKDLRPFRATAIASQEVRS